jgi:hypothetical protein
MLTLLSGEIQQQEDRVAGQSYTIVLYKPDPDGSRKALVVSEGQNNLNEPGT